MSCIYGKLSNASNSVYLRKDHFYAARLLNPGVASPREPMILTVFRSRLNTVMLDDYRRCTERTVTLVRAVPGYIAHKSFVADDGERVTLVEFASDEALHAWARDPVHAEAKRNGRAGFFTDYRVQVCEVLRDSADRRGTPAPDS